MTTSPVSRPLQSFPKSSSTVQSSRLSVLSSNLPSHSRSSSHARSSKPRPTVPPNEFLSEVATSALIRKVLIPENGHGSDTSSSTRPIGESLPPLTSSNEIDIQLYAIIAIVIKDFVQVWYSKITPDPTFVEEVVQIIAHCSRCLEQRLRYVDLSALCLDEIPAVLERHVSVYRSAKAAQSHLPYSNTKQSIYHTLSPHPALPVPPNKSTTTSPSPDLSDEAVYRQVLVQGVLSLLLPTEDLQNASLTVLVGDIVADLILGRVLEEKLCQGWFVHEMVSKVIGIVAHDRTTQTKLTPTTDDNQIRLEKFGLLSSKDDVHASHSSKEHQSTFGTFFWTLLQRAYSAFLFLCFIMVGMSQARLQTPQPRYAPSRHSSPSTSAVASGSDVSPRSTSTAVNSPESRPVLTYRIFAFVSTLLDMSLRMPWLTGMMNFGQYVLTGQLIPLIGFDSILDRFLIQTIEKHVLTPSILPKLLLNTRAVLFPNNAMGPSAPPPPNSDEQIRIRRKAAEDILSLVPLSVAKRFFSVTGADAKDLVSEEAIVQDGMQNLNDVNMGLATREEILRQIEEDILDVFGDSYMNKHFIYGILELVLVKLVPELLNKTPTQLLAARGVLAESLIEDDNQTDFLIPKNTSHQNPDENGLGIETETSSTPISRVNTNNTITNFVPITNSNSNSSSNNNNKHNSESGRKSRPESPALSKKTMTATTATDEKNMNPKQPSQHHVSRPSQELRLNATTSLPAMSPSERKRIRRVDDLAL